MTREIIRKKLIFNKGIYLIISNKEDGKNGINSKSLISNDTTATRSCNDSQSVENKKDQGA